MRFLCVLWYLWYKFQRFPLYDPQCEGKQAPHYQTWRPGLLWRLTVTSTAGLLSDFLILSGVFLFCFVFF